MAAILLRMARFDAFNANTQPEPPDREFAWAEAKGTPLSLRMLEGKPRSLKSLSNTRVAQRQNNAWVTRRRYGASEDCVPLGFHFPGGKNLNLRLRSRRLSSSKCRERAFSKSLIDTRPRNFLVARSSTGIRVQPFSTMRYTNTGLNRTGSH